MSKKVKKLFKKKKEGQYVTKDDFTVALETTTDANLKHMAKAIAKEQKGRKKGESNAE